MSDFPIQSWLSDMQQAVARIAELGRSMLKTHRAASKQAAEAADRWTLEERLAEERQALLDLFESVRRIVQSIQKCRDAMHGAEQNPEHSIHNCADTIEEFLPQIEGALVTVRHAALDLLQWTARSAKIEGSELPAEYRASYGRLIEYAPVFNPFMKSFQDELLRLNCNSRLDAEVQRLVSLVSRYNAVVDSARGFVRSVVEPPLELVFHETQSFLEDFDTLPNEQMTQLATEVNDCCQLLLYDPAEFNRRVQHVRPDLAKGIEASLTVLDVSGNYHVVFTADEDPVFHQLIITLLRVLPEDQLPGAKDELTRTLYKHFASE